MNETQTQLDLNNLLEHWLPFSLTLTRTLPFLLHIIYSFYLIILLIKQSFNVDQSRSTFQTSRGNHRKVAVFQLHHKDWHSSSWNRCHRSCHLSRTLCCERREYCFDRFSDCVYIPWQGNPNFLCFWTICAFIWHYMFPPNPPLSLHPMIDITRTLLSMGWGSYQPHQKRSQ